MEIILLDCTDLCDRENEAKAILPPDRVEKIERFVYYKDRSLSIGAGLLMRYVENEYGVKISVDADGKPQTDKNDVNFNVSHSGTYAVCAISRCPVGIDIEIEEEYDDNILISSLSPEEKLLFEKIPADERENMFFRIWTAKESYLKATGKGMSVSPDSIQVLTENGIAERINGFMISEIDSPEGYAITVCHDPKDNRINVRNADGKEFF